MNNNYDAFLTALKACLSMANEYLNRCVIEGSLDKGNIYMFNNLLALSIDPTSGLPRLICSNTDPNDNNEAVHSYNLKFMNINQELFNKTSEDFDKAHINESLTTMIKLLNPELKIELYNELRVVLKDVLQDLGGL